VNILLLFDLQNHVVVEKSYICIHASTHTNTCIIIFEAGCELKNKTNITYT
jgi:hypothetical protein